MNDTRVIPTEETYYNSMYDTSMNGTFQDPIVVLFSRIQKYTNPIICVFGIFGNILAVLVFLNKSQRTASCSIYLAARSMSDTGFLLALLVVWITDIGLDLFNIQVICQLVVFFTYICGFLSVWFVVLVTIESYIRICHPFTVKKYCTTKIAKRVISVFIIFSLVLYNFPLWTTRVQETANGASCSVIRTYDLINQILIYTDTGITLVIPTCLIIGLLIAITFRVLHNYHRRRQVKGKRADRRSNNPQSKVTRLLFSVSLVFILLNLPSHVFRVFVTVSRYVLHSPEPTPTDRAIHFTFQTFYYSSFAVNIIIYLLCGAKFRDEFYRIFIAKIYQPSIGRNTSTGVIEFKEIKDTNDTVDGTNV